ncbi:MAG: DUF1549 and DUF1553 domain-containing protein [Planctomycetaceae bacterium]
MSIFRIMIVPIVAAFSLMCPAAIVEAQTSTSDAVIRPSVTQRFAAADAGGEVPDFQQHVVPLLGKLGCNGRACHGSFQGRGGFRLSLFGYDFANDHNEIHGRIDPEVPADSIFLQKPLMQVPHEGGQRMKTGSWEHHLLVRWIESGAQGQPEEGPSLSALEVTPKEILFSEDGQQQQLNAVAVWSNGHREDVTALCRFQTNDDQIADVTPDGLVLAGAPGDTHIVAFYDRAVVPVPVIRPVTELTDDRYPAVSTPTKIDELVVQKLRKVGIVPSDLCSDAEFLRRVSLDVTGTLPTSNEVRSFLADTDPEKRRRKIDELLERPGYVAWWTTRLCDYTGNSDDKLNNVTPIKPEASKQWYAWIEKRVRDNMPYDEIVEGIVMAVSRDPGESYQQYCENISRLYPKGGRGAAGYADRACLPHFWARQNFQTSEDRVIGFAYTFLGTRIQCAQCHKHPFDQWTQDDFQQFEGFFKGTSARQNPRPDAKQEYDAMVAGFEGTEGLKGNDLRKVLAAKLTAGATIPLAEVFAVKAKPGQTKRNKDKKPQKGKAARAGVVPTTAKILAGPVVDLTKYEDVRQPLMDWLRSPDNPLFAKAFVNRIWANYFNAGIVQPADDFNLANPPVNAPLLEYLARGFIEHHFDMKWLHREILNSRTYQLSWIPNSTNRLDERNFSRAVPRRLPAEIAFDMMTQATRNDRKYAEFVTVLNRRALTIPGSALKARNTNPADYALTVFGRSIRDTNCDCDRTEEPSLLQTIFVRNDGQLLSMIDDADGWLVQIAHEYNLPFERKSQPEKSDEKKARAGAMRRFKVQIQRIQEQIAAAEEAGKTQQAKRLHDQLQKVRRSAKQLDAPATEDDDKSPTDSESEKTVATPVVPTWNVMEIINEAYLRTLSRFPTDDELQTAEMYISDSADPVDGVRGVLWALINTREFIVNH